MIEAFRNRIIITAPDMKEIVQDVTTIQVSVGPEYIRFTEPVKQANGLLVCTGSVRL